MGYGDLRHLIRRAASDKVLRDNPFTIANVKWDQYQRSIASIVYKVFN